VWQPDLEVVVVDDVHLVILVGNSAIPSLIGEAFIKYNTWISCGLSL
jgi:hypothetical protein